MAIEICSIILPGNEKAFTVGERKGAQTLDELAADYRMLLTEPVTATLATVGDNKVPQLTPVWVNHDANFINLNSVKGRVKDRNLRARPQVALMLLNPKNPYHWMTIYGTVSECVYEDDKSRGHLATENIDDLAQKYLGKRPYPFRDPKGEVRALYRVRPTRILTFGAP
jgi:PPOX class probable F420-dependent enzyme